MTVRFTVGGVLWLGLRTWARGALRFLVITLLIAGPILLWYAALANGTLRAFYDYMFRQNPIVRDLVSGRYLLFAMTTAAIAHSVAAASVDARPPVGSALKACVRRFFPVAGVAILAVALTSLGAMLLDAIAASAWLEGWLYGVVGALSSIVRSLLYLAIPIAVIERRGLVASIVRGFVLTRGVRLRVWAIVALLHIVAWGGNQLPWIVLMPYWKRVGAPTSTLAALGFATFAYSMLWLSISAVINAVAYRVLRDAKEGPPPDELASVFE